MREGHRNVPLQTILVVRSCRESEGCDSMGALLGQPVMMMTHAVLTQKIPMYQVSLVAGWCFGGQL